MRYYWVVTSLQPCRNVRSIKRKVPISEPYGRGAFLIQTVNMVALVIYEGPAVHQADTYIQSIPTEHFEFLRKFVKKNDPTKTEDFLWIQDNYHVQSNFILNVTNFKSNMFGSFNKINSNGPESKNLNVFENQFLKVQITILNMRNFRKNMKEFPSAKHVSWQDVSLNEQKCSSIRYIHYTDQLFDHASVMNSDSYFLHHLFILF